MSWQGVLVISVLGTIIGSVLLFAAYHGLKRLLRWHVENVCEAVKKELRLEGVRKELERLGNKVAYSRREGKRLEKRLADLEHLMVDDGDNDSSTTDG